MKMSEPDEPSSREEVAQAGDTSRTRLSTIGDNLFMVGDRNRHKGLHSVPSGAREELVI